MNQQLQTAAQVSTQTWQVLCKAKVQTQHGHRNADTAWTQECRHNNMDTGMQTQHAWWWIVCMQASRCNAMCGVASSVCVCVVLCMLCRPRVSVDHPVPTLPRTGSLGTCCRQCGVQLKRKQQQREQHRRCSGSVATWLSTESRDSPRHVIAVLYEPCLRDWW